MQQRFQVLIVDDEPLARSGMLTLVEKDPELEVAGECGNGRTAVEAILELQPDLVLLDLYLDGAQGFDLLQDIKGISPDLPVIIWTAYDSFRDDLRLSRADGYVIKSFDFGGIKQAIADVLLGKPTRGQTEVEATRYAAGWAW